MNKILLYFSLLSFLFCLNADAQNMDFKDGLDAYKSGDYKKSISIMDSVIKDTPDFFTAYYILGLSQHRSKMYMEAIDTLKKASELRPKNGKVLTNLSRVYIDSGSNELALSSALEGAKLSPDTSAFNVVGRAYLVNKNYDNAIKAFKQAIDIDQLNAWALNNLGYTYILMNDFDNAFEPLKNAVKIDPKNALFKKNFDFANAQINKSATPEE